MLTSAHTLTCPSPDAGTLLTSSTRRRLPVQLAASADVPPSEVTKEAYAAQDVKSRYALTCGAEAITQ